MALGAFSLPAPSRILPWKPGWAKMHVRPRVPLHCLDGLGVTSGAPIALSQVMMQGSSNKFDRESFLSTAYSLFGPTCEKRGPGDISILVLLKAGTRYVEPVPIDTADVRASGCPALHYIPLNVVQDIGRMDESDGFQYIQWQNKIIKSYKVYTEESAKVTE